MSETLPQSAGQAPKPARPGGIPLRWVVAGGAALVAASVIGPLAYHRSLRADLYEPAPAAVEEVAADAEALAAAEARVRAAQAAGGWVGVDEDAWNRLLYAEVLADPARSMRVRLEPPFVRLRFSQREGEGPDGAPRYLNGVLLAQLYAGEDALGIAVHAGEIGAVSISRTAGEWVRTRLERQLAHDVASHARTGPLFRGLREVRVREGRVELRYAGSGTP